MSWKLLFKTTTSLQTYLMLLSRHIWLSVAGDKANSTLHSPNLIKEGIINREEPSF